MHEVEAVGDSLTARSDRNRGQARLAGAIPAADGAVRGEKLADDHDEHAGDDHADDPAADAPELDPLSSDRRAEAGPGGRAGVHAATVRSVPGCRCHDSCPSVMA